MYPWVPINKMPTDELEKDTETTIINEAHISQPICTAVQLALTDLLRAWRVSPVAVTGHSSGEIGAAYAAGILSLDSSMAIAYYRGLVTTLLKKKFPSLQGSMMAVGCTKDEIGPLIARLKAKEVRIACYNSPSSLTISGDEPAIDELHHVMDKLQMFNRKLQVEMAYHSHHMELVARDYKGCLEGLEAPKATEVKFYSSLYGRLANGTELIAQYWVDNLTQSVRFSEALTNMCQPTDEHKTGINLLIEIGPHSALAGPIKQILKACGTDGTKIAYTSALVRKKDAVDTALDLASTLFNKGLNLDLGAINLNSPSKQPALLIDMPRYPWNHQTKYWHEPRLMQKHKSRTAPRHDILGTLANYSNDLEPTWRNILRVDDLAWLRHHQIQSLTLFPISGFVSMAVEAMSQRAALRDIPYDNFEIRDVTVNTPLMITDDDIEITLQLRPHQESTLSCSNVWDEFRIHSWAANKGWTEHCKGLIRVNSATSSNFTQSFVKAIAGPEKQSVNKDVIYNSLLELGVSYGPTFQGFVDCQASSNSSVANIIVGDTASYMPLGYQTKSIIHPALLEQLIEMYWPILGAGRISMDTVYLPSSIERISISRNISELIKSPGDALRAYCTGELPPSHPRPTQMSMLATTLEDAKSSLVMIENLTIAPVIERQMSAENEAHRELCYKLDWEPILEPLDTAPNGTVPHLNGITNVTVNNHSNGTLHVVPEWPQGDIVIIHGDSETQLLLSTKLAHTVELATGNAPVTGTLSDVDTNGKLCLFLSEIDEILLSSLTTEQFTQLQKALINVKGILWVVRGAYAHSSRPDVNMVTGLSRSIRSETLLKFATLDLDAQQMLSPENTVRAIYETFKATFCSKATADCELEFMERKGAFFTPRIIDDALINEYVHKHTTSSMLESTPFLQKDRPLRMAIKTPGVFDTLHFVDQSLEETLRDDEIEVEVKAIGMNARDISTAMGHFDDFDFGSECSGLVTRVGSSVERLQKGDRVTCILTSGGSYSSYSRTKHDFAFKIKDGMLFEAAASLPVAYCTAQYGLVDLGRVEEADTILINSAMTAVGQACLNLAQAKKAKVFAVVESIEDKEALVKGFGLSEDHIFTSQAEACTLVNQGRFEILLNCTSVDADALRTLWVGLSNFGRFIELGGTRARLEMGSVDNNKSFMSADLMNLAIQRPKLLGRLMSSISNLLQNGTLKPLPTTLFPISDIETAFKTMQSGNISGKFVVAPQPGNKVKVSNLSALFRWFQRITTDSFQATPSCRQNQLLRPDATYVLIGGTGGLGRSMARWMSNKGARNLVLVSRSGSITGKVKELIDELALGNNTNVVVRPCDVSDEKAVKRLIREDLAKMPAIRGVIHAAMVLNDVLFEKMTFEQYTTVVESKVKGAWNFHNSLVASKAELDFFVAISSAAGAVGNRGQAAYSAANTFLNAFVQHRLSLSLPASSIDLTAVSDAGYLAENAEAAAEVSRNLGSDTICEAEVLALLNAAIDGTLARACNNHIITGMRITTPPPFWTNDVKFKHLRLAAEAASASSASVTIVSFNTQLKAAKSLAEAEDVVRRGLCAKLPSVLMLEEEDMDVTRSLSNYALDSLVAIEVRNYITREFEANLQVLELLSSGSIETLAKAICLKSKLVSFDA